MQLTDAITRLYGKIRNNLPMFGAQLRGRWGDILALAVLSALIAWNCTAFLNSRGVSKRHDAYHHIKYAYHLVHEGAFTRKLDNKGRPTPDAYREPFFAAYMAVGIRFDETLRPLQPEQLIASHNLLALKKQQIPVLLATALLAFVAAALIGRKRWVAYSAMAFVGFSDSLNASVNYLTTEHHAAFWTLALSLLVFFGLRSMSRRVLATAGGAAGVLVLCKASFMFVIWPILLLFFLIGRARGVDLKRLGVNLGILFLCFALPVGSWMIRNYGQYGTFFLTHRGGNVLAIRAAYNRMNDNEFNGAFLYWTPDPLAEELLNESYGENALALGAVLGNLNRANAKSYYRKGRHQRNKVVKQHGAETPYTDAIVKKAAMKQILSHPFKHLRAMLPLGWRSIFVESGFSLRRPLRFAIDGGAAISLLLIAGFLAALFATIRRRNWAFFGFLFPSFYLMSLNLAVSHCLPRYNQPAIPIFVIALLLLAVKSSVAPGKS